MEVIWPRREIIAIGGSAGSIEVIRQICRSFPAGLQASVVIAVHVGARDQNLLAGILDSGGPLTAQYRDGWRTALEQARVYVAPADHHLVIDGPCVRLGRGPRETWLARRSIPSFARSVISAGSEGYRRVALRDAE